MEIKNLTCIRCPLGCDLEVTIEGNEVTDVKGFGCKRGVDYAHKEILNPTRTLTTTLPLINGQIRMVPVKTKEDVAKSKLEDCLAVLAEVNVEAPVTVGDVIVANVADTGVDIVATRTIPKK